VSRDSNLSAEYRTSKHEKSPGAKNAWVVKMEPSSTITAAQNRRRGKDQVIGGPAQR